MAWHGMALPGRRAACESLPSLRSARVPSCPAPPAAHRSYWQARQRPHTHTRVQSRPVPSHTRAACRRTCAPAHTARTVDWTVSAVARRGRNRAATPKPYSLGVLPILRGAGGLSCGPQRAWIGFAWRSLDWRVFSVSAVRSSASPRGSCSAPGTSHGGSGSVRAAVGADDNAAELDGRRASSARSASFSAASRSNATLRSCSCAAEPREHIGRSRNKR